MCSSRISGPHDITGQAAAGSVTRFEPKDERRAGESSESPGIFTFDHLIDPVLWIGGEFLQNLPDLIASLLVRRIVEHDCGRATGAPGPGLPRLQLFLLIELDQSGLLQRRIEMRLSVGGDVPVIRYDADDIPVSKCSVGGAANLADQRIEPLERPASRVRVWSRVVLFLVKT